MLKIDHTGITYNRLTGIKFVCNRERQSIWLWQCSCGKTSLADGSKVKNGNTKSCGCYRSEKNKEIHTPTMYVINKGRKRNKGNDAWKALGDADRGKDIDD